MNSGSTSAYSMSVDCSAEDGKALIMLSGRITLADVKALWGRLSSEAGGVDTFVFECSQLDTIDTAGIALLVAFAREQRAAGRKTVIQDLRLGAAALVDYMGWDVLLQPEMPETMAAESTEEPGPAQGEATTGEMRVTAAHRGKRGTLACAVGAVTGEICGTLVFIGHSAAALCHTVLHPKHGRWRDMLRCLELSGTGAVPVVCSISFLVGFVVAFQAALQLERFGAKILIANMVGLALCRELAPIMTSVIMSGRTASAFAAEIGTMKVSEELDAMTTMVLDPFRFLVVPKILACLIAFPCLTILADLAGLLGGVVVGATFLDIPPLVFLNEAYQTMKFTDITMGLYKSVVFAVLVSGVGCLRGMQVGLGADSVGRAATSAAVSGIFLTVLSNAMLTMSGYLL